MEERKDISDMSFEEFFSKKEGESVASKPVAESIKTKVHNGGEVQKGFGTTSPKLNLNGHVFDLYVPRYGSDENARFEASIDCASGVIPMGKLDSSPRGSGRLSRPATLNITEAGISPFEQFTLIIDGEEVYTYKPRRILFFNNVGMPMGKPAGDTFVVYPVSGTIRTSRAEIKDSFVVGDAKVVHAEVSLAGGVWIDDTPETVEEPAETLHEVPTTEKAAVKETEAPKPKVKKGRRKKPTGSIKMPQGVQSADAILNGEIVPIFDKSPVFEVKVENREPEECSISIERPDGSVMVQGKAPSRGAMYFDIPGTGVMDLVLKHEDAELARSRFVFIPDFSCERKGNGDFAEDSVYTMTAYGTTSTHDSTEGPVSFDRDGQVHEILCYVPAIEFDTGSGFTRYSCDTETVDADVDTLGDRIRFKVDGAKKFSIFVGPEKGKKVEMELEPAGDVFVADLEPLKSQIYNSKNERFVLFVTVNSFPMRRLMTISNPVRVTASCKDGVLTAEVRRQGAFECRFFMKDKSVTTVQLVQGDNSLEVPADCVEAEVAEVANGATRSTIPVQVRPLPFLDRDETGEIWMFVSKDKRIPLPEALSASRPQPAAIKQWHDQIVRMNPELRGVTAAMMQSAFDSMGW